MSKGTLNKIMLIGNIGQDPKIVTFDNGGKIANVSLATSDSYTDKSGQKHESTEWHNITFGGKVVDIVEKYVKKGSKLYVEGKVTTRKYTDKDGVEKYTTEIKAFNMTMLDSKSQANQPKQGEPVKFPEEDSDIPF